MGSTEFSEADCRLGVKELHVLFYMKQRFNTMFKKLTSDSSDLNSIRQSLEYSGGKIAIRFFMVVLSNFRHMPEEYSIYVMTSYFDIFFHSQFTLTHSNI